MGLSVAAAGLNSEMGYKRCAHLLQCAGFGQRELLLMAHELASCSAARGTPNHTSYSMPCSSVSVAVPCPAVPTAVGTSVSSAGCSISEKSSCDKEHNQMMARRVWVRRRGRESRKRGRGEGRER